MPGAVFADGTYNYGKWHLTLGGRYSIDRAGERFQSYPSIGSGGFGGYLSANHTFQPKLHRPRLWAWAPCFLGSWQGSQRQSETQQPTRTTNEARIVRLIFERYLALGSVHVLQRWLANKTARIVWAVLTRGEVYRPVALA